MFDHIATKTLLKCVGQCLDCAAHYARRNPNAANRESCEFWASRADMLTEEIMRRATRRISLRPRP